MQNPDRFSKPVWINYLKSKYFLFVVFNRFASANQVAVAKSIVNTDNRWPVFILATSSILNFRKNVPNR